MEKKNFSKKFLHRIKWLLIILLILAVLGIGIRIIQYIRLRYATEQQAILNVAVIKAQAGPVEIKIVLPGNVTAWHEATIFARTNGYLINWMVDIGARVKTGDVLAEISSPETNAALRQAEADLKTAQANNYLAQTTAKRWQLLLKTDSVSKQETDEKVSDAKAKAALVVAAKANRDRLRDLVSYERVLAPFDGIIMSRTTDIGRLINAGSSGTVPLFRLVQAKRLRVYVKVPEYFSGNIVPGITTRLSFREHPGKSFKATLLDTAKAIDPVSRTLLVQLEIDNPNYELLPGSYTEVHFTLPGNQSVHLPVNTLIFRASGMQVAAIDGDNKAIFKPIIIGRDFGSTVEVVYGVKANETIILNPPDSLLSGQKVRIVSSKVLAKDSP